MKFITLFPKKSELKTLMIRWGIIVFLSLIGLNYLTDIPNKSYEGKLLPLSKIGLIVKQIF